MLAVEAVTVAMNFMTFTFVTLQYEVSAATCNCKCHATTEPVTKPKFCFKVGVYTHGF